MRSRLWGLAQLPVTDGVSLAHNAIFLQETSVMAKRVSRCRKESMGVSALVLLGGIWELHRTSGLAAQPLTWEREVIASPRLYVRSERSDKVGSFLFYYAIPAPPDSPELYARRHDIEDLKETHDEVDNNRSIWHFLTPSDYTKLCSATEHARQDPLADAATITIRENYLTAHFLGILDLETADPEHWLKRLFDKLIGKEHTVVNLHVWLGAPRGMIQEKLDRSAWQEMTHNLDRLLAPRVGAQQVMEGLWSEEQQVKFIYRLNLALGGRVDFIFDGKLWEAMRLKLNWPEDLKLGLAEGCYVADGLLYHPSQKLITLLDHSEPNPLLRKLQPIAQAAKDPLKVAELIAEHWCNYKLPVASKDLPFIAQCSAVTENMGYSLFAAADDDCLDRQGFAKLWENCVLSDAILAIVQEHGRMGRLASYPFITNVLTRRAARIMGDPNLEVTVQRPTNADAPAAC